MSLSSLELHIRAPRTIGLDFLSTEPLDMLHTRVSYHVKSENEAGDDDKLPSALRIGLDRRVPMPAIMQNNDLSYYQSLELVPGTISLPETMVDLPRYARCAKMSCRCFR